MLWYAKKGPNSVKFNYNIKVYNLNSSRMMLESGVFFFSLYFQKFNFFFFVAILVHRWLPGSRNLKKSVHLCLQGLALACGIFGIWTKFHSSDGIVANFYSLHSWMGLICVSLFGAQVFLLHIVFPHRYFFY